MRSLRVLLVLVLLGVAVRAADQPAAAAAARESFEVFHNASPGKFTLRGELQILDDGTARYQPVSVHDPPQLPSADVPPQDPTTYAVVLRSLKNGAQFVRPISRCRLHGADTEETFVAHESEAGDVFHIDYDAGTRANCMAPDRSPFAPAAHSRALLRRRAAGPVPRLAEPVRIDAATGKEQAPEAPRSFIAKYWYYILPIVVLLLFTGEEPQQEGGAQRQ
ncbi:hypothetical protein IWQ56_000490 [Coemansia nantahalensis]|uniref:Uncharacterized protein n=2 Tax=Coemansia TaxID=4863 RepID=A0ACC1L606_9FUNG|nr:hypothetical protein IWQ57_005012 [Coemansia nantahalensis]KAJ2774649.1 hypothetical protein IWQ56_000490 [Coemansia nantahalensis]KAJ2802112.1 hypothetical protein H4R21_002540 [Coemansia helicoidea]